MDKNNHTPSSPQPEIDLIALEPAIPTCDAMTVSTCGKNDVSS